MPVTYKSIDLTVTLRLHLKNSFLTPEEEAARFGDHFRNVDNLRLAWSGSGSGLAVSVTSVLVEPRDSVQTAVWYSPDAVRAHFDGLEGVAGESGECSTLLGMIPDDVLHRAAVEWINGNDILWEDFHRACVQIVRDADRIVRLPATPAPSGA